MSGPGVEMVVGEGEAGRDVTLIHEMCHTGHPGDGVIWVTAVETFRRIRLKG